MSKMTDTLPKHVVHVNSQADFEDCLDVLRDTPLIALDTEFMRTNTFYPKMGLLQLANEETCYLVDPLTIDDWSSFSALLQDDQLSFILHSSGEDLNLMLSFLGCLPTNLIDTQIAAAFLGLGYSLSYQALVAELLDQELEKSETRSDWLQRPLTEKQLHYAAMDVMHLHEAWELLESRLTDRDKLDWFYIECDEAVTIASDTESERRWELLYTEVSNAWKLDEEGLARLQRLCFWREQTARRRNKPKNWIATDRDLFLLAKDLPHADALSMDTLTRVRDVDFAVIKRYGNDLIECLQDSGLALPEVDRTLLNLPLPPAMRRTLKSCQRAVQHRAEELDLAPELLGRKRQLLTLLRDLQHRGIDAWPGIFSGWRDEILQADFIPILKDVA